MNSIFSRGIMKSVMMGASMFGLGGCPNIDVEIPQEARTNVSGLDTVDKILSQPAVNGFMNELVARGEEFPIYRGPWPADIIGAYRATANLEAKTNEGWIGIDKFKFDTWFSQTPENIINSDYTSYTAPAVGECACRQDEKLAEIITGCGCDDNFSIFTITKRTETLIPLADTCETYFVEILSGKKEEDGDLKTRYMEVPLTGNCGYVSVYGKIDFDNKAENEDED